MVSGRVVSACPVKFEVYPVKFDEGEYFYREGEYFTGGKLVRG